MHTKRIIPCLDVNNNRVVKGINFVNLRDAGDPVEVAAAYDKAGADELVFLDKVSVNSAAIMNPDLISEAADKFGSQCVVVAIDAKRHGASWNIYKNGGRIDMGIDAIEWAVEAQRRGAGELLVTSMDCDGTKAGYDIELTAEIAKRVDIPVIASGGAGEKVHFYDALTVGGADAALAASLFHYKELEIMDLKAYLKDKGVAVRV